MAGWPTLTLRGLTTAMDPAAAAPLSARRFPFWLRSFEPTPAAAEPITEPAAIRQGYRRWQRRVLLSSIIGYATFYFVRKNLRVAMPFMERDLGISKSDLGLFITLLKLMVTSRWQTPPGM